jgi:hypothetical protein
MNAGSDATKAGSFVGRLGPLAATLGIGLAVMAGGTGVATADPVTRDASPSSASDRSTQPAGVGRARGNRDLGARGASVRPDFARTARVTSRPVRSSRSEPAPVAA